MISPFSQITYFTVITLIYFCLKYYLVDSYGKDSKGLGIAMIIGYLAIMLFMQVSANISNAKEKCGGTPQTLTAINYTIIPNFLIFGLLLLCLKLYDGWKAPFSNTIGYIIVSSSMFGINEIFKKMLIPTDLESDDPEVVARAQRRVHGNKLLKMVTKDPSLMINYITPSNFDLFLSRMSGDPSAADDNSILSESYEEYKAKLYNLVVIKDKVSEFLWYILTGALVISNSNTYIMSIKCKRSPEELNAKLQKRMSSQASKKTEKEQKWTLGY